MALNRCGKVLSNAAVHLDVGEMCCWRPVWEDRDRCVWHADEAGKPVEALEALRPGPGECLGGVVLRDTTIIGRDWFADCMVVGADLTDADLRDCDLSNAELMFATLERTNARYADFTGANLEGAVIRDADLRSAALDDARLDQTVFTDTHINQETSFGERTVYERAEVVPEMSERTHRLQAAAWAYRELQDVYAYNSLPGETRDSYVREKDARRRLAWATNDYPRALMQEGSRWVMKYGSSPWRLLGTSLALIAVCAVLYPVTGGIQEIQAEQTVTYTIDDPTEASPWWLGQVFLKSFYFSVVTFATLGYGDIQPIGPWARALASVETILGSILAALLVFVLARSVTW